jgi:hypothetical protein
MYSVIPPGGTLTTEGTFVPYSTRQVVYYTSASAGAKINVSYGSGGSWSALPNASGYVCNGSVTPEVGGVCDALVPKAVQQLQITNSGTADLYIINYAQIDTTQNGVVAWNLARAGLSLPNEASTPTALMQPWLNNYQPDLVLTEWKQNGITGGVGGCQQAADVSPTAFRDYIEWYNQLLSEPLTSNPLADVIAIGDYEINGGASCIASFNEQVRKWTASQPHPQTYVDLYSQASFNDEVALGWIAGSGDTVHQSPLGQAAESQFVLQYLGLDQWSSGAVTKPINNTSYVTTPSVIVSGSAPGITQQTRNANIDFSLNIGRGLIVNDYTGAQMFYLASPNTPQAGSNYLPPFQIGTGKVSGKSGVWLCGSTGFAGAYQNCGNGTPADWTMRGANASYIETPWWGSDIAGAVNLANTTTASYSFKNGPVNGHYNGVFCVWTPRGDTGQGVRYWDTSTGEAASVSFSSPVTLTVNYHCTMTP